MANPRRIDIGVEGFQQQELTKHELLTSSDEFMLSRQYKLGVNIRNQAKSMSDEMGREVKHEELSQFLRVPVSQISFLLERSDLAKEKLVGANMRLVFHIARFYRYRGIAYPDLVQEGTFGLMKAVDKYDPERGFRFSTYASWWIKQAVSRAVAEKSRIVRLPVHIHDLMVSMSRVEKSFVMSHSRKPTTQELADRLALPVQKVELLVKSKREVNSIDEDAFQGQTSKGQSSNAIQVKDRLASDVPEPSTMNEKIFLRTELQRSMTHLNEREAQIVEMRFGLSNKNPMTLEEIGKHFNVTRERVRQIEFRALEKLRNPSKNSELGEIINSILQSDSKVDDTSKPSEMNEKDYSRLKVSSSTTAQTKLESNSILENLVSAGR